MCLSFMRCSWFGQYSHDVSIVQEFDWLRILAVFPHQREEPDAALADAEVGRGEGHLGIQRRLAAFWVVLGWPAEDMPRPGVPFGMKGACKLPDS